MSYEEVRKHAEGRYPFLFSNPECKRALLRNPRLGIPESREWRHYPVVDRSDFGGLMFCPDKGWFPLDIFEALFLGRESCLVGEQDGCMVFEEPADFRRGCVGRSLWRSHQSLAWDVENICPDSAEVLELKKRCDQKGSFVVAKAFIAAVDLYTEEVLFIARERAKESFGGKEGKLDMPGGKVGGRWGFGPKYGIDHFQTTLRRELEEETGELGPSERTRKGFVIVYLERPGGAGVIDFTEVCVLHSDSLESLVAVMNSSAVESPDRRKGYSRWKIYRYGEGVESSDFLPSTAFVLKRLFEEPDPVRVQGCGGMTALVLYNRLISECRGLMANEVDLYNLPKSRVSGGLE